MKLNNDMLKHTVVQINEMQSAMREAAERIEGSQEYIAKQMEIFKENENLKNLKKMLKVQREQVANSFFAHNQTMKSVSSEIAHLQKQSGLGLSNNIELKRLVESIKEQEQKIKDNFLSTYNKNNNDDS